MADYWVSAKRGDDSNNGTSIATPWATVSKAATTNVGAGSTVHIMPGTYREKPVLGYSGSAGNPITFKGHPEGYPGYEEPGIVRITGCGADEIATVGVVITVQQPYIHLMEFFVDGALGDAVYVGFDAYSSKIIGLFACASGNAIRGGNLERCIGIGGQFGFFGVRDISQSLAIAGGTCIDNAGMGTVNSCIALGGTTGYAYLNTVYNSIAIGSGTAFISANAVNCLALCSYVGFSGQNYQNCVAAYCTTSYKNENVTDCVAICCLTTPEAIPQAPILSFEFSRLKELLSVFKPWMFDSLKQWGKTDGVDAGDFDILGLPRKMLAGGLDIGPWAFSDVEPEYVTVKTESPAIKITRAGAQKFTFYADGGAQFVRRVWTKWVNVDNNKKPQIYIKGDSLQQVAVTATGDGTDWELLTIMGTPIAGGEVELFLYARDTAADAVVYFSDLE